MIPWKLIALFLSWLVVAVAVYEHEQSEFEKERAVAKAALDSANQHAKEISDERESTVAKISSDLANQTAKADKASKDLHDHIASGALRLSIAGSCGGKLPNDPALTGSNNQGQCNIDPGIAQSLVGLTERGDEAITKLNACIDAYNSLRDNP
jgi:hypothetical protein